NSYAPLPLDQYYNAAAAYPLTRLEPIDGVTRIVEDHIGFTGYDSNGVQRPPTPPSNVANPSVGPSTNWIAPTTGPILPIDDGGASGLPLSTEVTPFTLADVNLFVSTTTSIQVVNPSVGGVNFTVNNALGNTNPLQDIAMRSDGNLFGYRDTDSGTGGAAG